MDSKKWEDAPVIQIIGIILSFGMFLAAAIWL